MVDYSVTPDEPDVSLAPQVGEPVVDSPYAYTEDEVEPSFKPIGTGPTDLGVTETVLKPAFKATVDAAAGLPQVVNTLLAGMVAFPLAGWAGLREMAWHEEEFQKRHPGKTRLQAGTEAVESVAALPFRFLYKPEQLRATEIMLSPITVIQGSAQWWGDLYFKNHPDDPVGAALIATSIEGAAFLGLPKLVHRMVNPPRGMFGDPVRWGEYFAELYEAAESRAVVRKSRAPVEKLDDILAEHLERYAPWKDWREGELGTMVEEHLKQHLPPEVAERMGTRARTMYRDEVSEAAEMHKGEVQTAPVVRGPSEFETVSPELSERVRAELNVDQMTDALTEAPIRRKYRLEDPETLADNMLDVLERSQESESARKIELSEAEVGGMQKAQELSGPTGFEEVRPAVAESVRNAILKDEAWSGLFEREFPRGVERADPGELLSAVKRVLDKEERIELAEQAQTELVTKSEISVGIDKGPTPRTAEEIARAPSGEERVSLNDLSALAERIGLRGEDYGILSEGAPPVPVAPKPEVGMQIEGMGRVRSMPYDAKTGEAKVVFEDPKTGKMSGVRLLGEVMDALKRSRLGSESGAINLGTAFEPAVRYVRKSKGNIRKFVKEMERLKRIVPDYEKGSLKSPVRQIPLIPKNIPKVVQDIPWVRRAVTASPAHRTADSFALRDRPVIDMAESHMANARNVSNAGSWMRDVLKDIPDASPKVEEAMKGIFQAYLPRLREYGRLISLNRRLTGRLKKYAKGTNQWRKTFSELTGVRIKLRMAHKAMEPFIDAYDANVVRLLQKYSDVRIALHAENKLTPLGNNRFKYTGRKAKGHKPITAVVHMSPKELLISTAVQQYMYKTGDALKALGIKTIGRKKSRAYMTHLWRNFVDDANIASFGRNLKTTPDVLTFVERLPGSRMWMPSVNAILKAYIPTAERKIAYQPFLNRWNDVIDGMTEPHLKAFMKKWIDKNLTYRPLKFWENLANAYISFEYARLIGLSLSVGFKHLLKLAGTWGEYGPLTNTIGVMKTLKVPVQAALERMGVAKGSYNELKAFRSYVSARDIVRTMDEFPVIKRLGKSKMMFKRAIGMPVTAVEAFDNGVSIMAGIITGLRRDVPFVDVQRQVWNTVLTVNFRGLMDQPLFQKNTLARGGTMFQMTPLKLWEYKVDLVQRAWRGERDVFGTHAGTKLVRYLTIIGLAESIARENNTSIMEMFIHPPFVRHLIGSRKDFPYFELHLPEPALPPVVDLWSRVAKSGWKEGLKKHFSYWGTASKWARAKEGKYSKNWYNSAMQSIFGIPKIGAKPRKTKGGRTVPMGGISTGLGGGL